MQIDAPFRESEPRPDVDTRTDPPARAIAIEPAIETHFDAIWRFVRRLGVPPHLSEDVCQEVFTIYARRIADVEPGSEKSFLFGTAVRVAKSMRRRHAVELSRHTELKEEFWTARENPEQLLHDRRALEILDSLLDSLGEPNRTVFVLFELEGFTVTEISELLAIPRGTVASRMRRARAEFMRRAASVRARLSSLRGDDE